MKTEKLVNTAYAVGAAIVIFGAWKKITHQDGDDLFLTIGLLTEVAIFIISAIIEWLPSKKQTIVEHTEYSVTQQLTDSSENTKALNNLNDTIKTIFNR